MWRNSKKLPPMSKDTLTERHAPPGFDPGLRFTSWCPDCETRSFVQKLGVVQVIWDCFKLSCCPSNDPNLTPQVRFRGVELFELPIPATMLDVRAIQSRENVRLAIAIVGQSPEPTQRATTIGAIDIYRHPPQKPVSGYYLRFFMHQRLTLVPNDKLD